LQPTKPTGDVVSGEATVVEAGQKARVVLSSGKSAEGVVLRASSDELVLGQPGNYGQKEIVFRSDEIVSIEVLAGSRTDSHMAVIVPALTIVLSVVGVAMYRSWNNLY
jgi:hypothetical protein